MAHVAFDSSYFRTRRNAPDHVQRAIAAVVRAMDEAAAAAALPGDREIIVPPTRRMMCHDIGVSGWALLYEVLPDRYFVRNVCRPG